jgi:hypothetical protein
MNSDLRTALVLASAALLGAGTAGVTSYLGEKAIVNRELGSEAQRHELEARGVALVYEEQLERAVEALKTSLTRGQWPNSQEARLFELPTIEERSEIQSRLSRESAGAVGDADTTIQDVYVAIGESPSGTLDEEGRNDVQGYISTLEEGANALEKLSK